MRQDRRVNRRGAVLTGLAALVLGAGAVQCGRLAAAGVSPSAGAGTADQVAGTVAAAATAVICAWLLLGLVLSAACALLDRKGRADDGRGLDRLTAAVAPVTLRHGVAALLGLTVAVSAVGGGAAVASPATGRGDTSVAVTTRVVAVPELGPGWSVTPAPAPTPPPTATPTATASASASASASTRPVAGAAPGWVPTAPAPVPTSARPSTGPGVGIGVTPRGPVDADGPDGIATDRPGPDRPTTRVDPDEIVVRRGDTLWSLAARHLGRDASDAQIALEWPTWFESNRTVIGSDPDRLLPGMRLRIPEGGSR